MPIGVQPDRITIGNEFVPRFLDLSHVLVVPAGAVVTAPADSTWDYIEVAGVLRVDRLKDTVLRFTHLVILPGGVLDVGTVADPIPADRRVQLIVRDVPINTARDPFQWGNALLNFGRQTRVGAQKAAWLPVDAALAAGDKGLTLAADPIGWRVGDELVVTDTVQRLPSPAKPRREGTVRITAIAGREVTLSKPLDFAHPAISDPDGAVILMPRVANLTRNITVASELPTGTPGHTANIGQDATWDVRYNAFVGLGRTRAVPLDSANPATGHIGTNQIGRYADHHHHAQGFGSTSIGNAYCGRAGGGKWGLAIHATHDELVEDNVAVDFPGAGFVTEDGYEVRNVFRHNLALYSLGNHTGDANIEGANVLNNNPGTAGNGFWFRGVTQTIDRNEAWNNAIGFNLFNQNQAAGLFPSKPGLMPDTVFNREVAVPVSFADNIGAANSFDGLEFWGLPSAPVQRVILAFNAAVQFFQAQSDPARPQFVDAQFVCSGGRGIGVGLVIGYTQSVSLAGGRVVGCRTGVSGPAITTRLIGVTLQNVTNIDYANVPQNGSSYYENVTHRALPGFSPEFIVFGTTAVWSPGDPLPVVPLSSWTIQQGSRHRIKNWQGTGQNFRLFERQQLASVAAWPSTNASEHAGDCPDAGLTMGQCWANYGLAYGGEALSDTEAIVLPGVINGLAHAGLDALLGPPRAVVTYPTIREAAPVTADGVLVHAVLTGDAKAASPLMFVSVDGAPPVGVPPPFESGIDQRLFYVKVAPQGVHEIRTWRATNAGQMIGASLMKFQFAVGAFTAPPPAPPPPPPSLPPVPPTPLPKTVPAIQWSNPKDVFAGTVLGAVQLNASSDVPGAFIYDPPAGTVLRAGLAQELRVTFVPTDGLTYSSQTASVRINVIASGDLNGSGVVDCADVAIVRAALGKRIGQPGYDSRADTNQDGVIDDRDLTFVTQKLAKGIRCL